MANTCFGFSFWFYKNVTFDIPSFRLWRMIFPLRMLEIASYLYVLKEHQQWPFAWNCSFWLNKCSEFNIHSCLLHKLTRTFAWSPSQKEIPFSACTLFIFFFYFSLFFLPLWFIFVYVYVCALACNCCMHMKLYYGSCSSFSKSPLDSSRRSWRYVFYCCHYKHIQSIAWWIYTFATFYNIRSLKSQNLKSFLVRLNGACPHRFFSEHQIFFNFSH